MMTPRRNELSVSYGQEEVRQVHFCDAKGQRLGLN